VPLRAPALRRALAPGRPAGGTDSRHDRRRARLSPRRSGARSARRRLDAPNHQMRPMTAEAVALTADLLAVAVAAGLTPYLALETTAAFGPESMADRLAAVLAAVADGRRFSDALDDEAAWTPTLAPLL